LSRLIWLLAERIAVQQVQVLVTVSEKLGERYHHRYPALRQIEIIRNLPCAEHVGTYVTPGVIKKNGHKIIIYQGHFKPGRGLKNLIQAVAMTGNVHLLLIGNGELEPVLKNMVRTEKLEDRIFFHDFIPMVELISVSAQGDLGAVLFEPTSLNYAAALPNKFFEYIMAGLPVLSSNIETFTYYIDKYDFGLTVDPSDIAAISRTITRMISDEEQLKKWKNNALKAAQELNWENEEKKLLKIYARYKG
jgi:glycosyltransferase involved in cell wall biosynthesis